MLVAGPHSFGFSTTKITPVKTSTSNRPRPAESSKLRKHFRRAIVRDWGVPTPARPMIFRVVVDGDHLLPLLKTTFEFHRTSSFVRFLPVQQA
jgi:hypothetical protein